MTVVELAFSDDPRRMAARPAHRETLRRLHDAGKLMMAGPWRDDSGALLVFAVDDAELDQILADDPYYRTSGVTVVSRRTWEPLRLDRSTGQ